MAHSSRLLLVMAGSFIHFDSLLTPVIYQVFSMTTTKYDYFREKKIDNVIARYIVCNFKRLEYKKNI